MARIRFDDEYVSSELEKVGNALTVPINLYPIYPFCVLCVLGGLLLIACWNLQSISQYCLVFIIECPEQCIKAIINTDIYYYTLIYN